MDMNMLRRALWGFLRPLLQLVTNLLNPEIGEEWMIEFKKFLRKEGCWVTKKAITIVRNRFKFAEFIGQRGLRIVANETDKRSAALTELDLDKVRFVTMLKGESYISGEENLYRLKASGKIRLDADVFYTLWTKQHLIPESWKEKMEDNIRYVFFDGTILRHPCGSHCVLYLYWSGFTWDWNVLLLDTNRVADYVSAVLEQAA
jgi:hypothetical protein